MLIVMHEAIERKGMMVKVSNTKMIMIERDESVTEYEIRIDSE